MRGMLRRYGVDEALLAPCANEGHTVMDRKLLAHSSIPHYTAYTTTITS
jgi:hypothetical protein